MIKPAISLGFEVGSGSPVEIPLKHLAITGQTQEAGKTTALEALIARSGLRAVTFITKRGEGSFVGSRRIDPYFREQADWQFVASILEASRGEKLKFERAWIIRASKGARTLADVHRNVRHAMEKAKGLSADVYLTLDAYLEAVVPQIARVRWAARLALAAGVNAVDLTPLNVEMQHLVIKSTLDWVLEHEDGTVVVIPEAWKFIPEGRGTPVKLAAEAFIRQAAALRNYLWLDSQDLGGISKTILRSVPLWLLGVQREANEIKRTLENIPSSVAKPKAADIATLELGQFYACWGRHAIKAYVQPAWMSEDVACQVAAGTLDVHHAAQPADAVRATRTLRHVLGQAPIPMTEDLVTKEEATRLERENHELRDQVKRLERDIADMSRRFEALTDIRVAGSHPLTETARREPVASRGSAPAAEPEGAEAIYQFVRTRLTEDAPALLQVLVEQPELVVTVARRTIEADGHSSVGRVARLIAEGFFDKPTSAYATWNESKRRGFSGAAARMDEACKKLQADGFLTREADGFQAVPGMKINIVERACA